MERITPRQNGDAAASTATKYTETTGLRKTHMKQARGEEDGGVVVPHVATPSLLWSHRLESGHMSHGTRGPRTMVTPSRLVLLLNLTVLAVPT